MDDPSKPSWLERLSAFLLREPEDREELIELLHSAFDRNLFDADALAMIEGVLQVSELCVGDIMIPRSQMDVLSVDQAVPDFLPFVMETAHSRFPVIGDNKDQVLGILLAKDLLRYFATPDDFDLRDSLRPAVFIPESKRLNVLLREFRETRNHMAIVVDEYGGVAGLVTIEDVIEQIVGDIEDEYDFDETEDHIVPQKNGLYRVKAVTELTDFNQVFGTEFSDEDYDTVGGLVVSQFRHLPKRGESIQIGELEFLVLRADSRRIHTLQVQRIHHTTPSSSCQPRLAAMARSSFWARCLSFYLRHFGKAILRPVCWPLFYCSYLDTAQHRPHVECIYGHSVPTVPTSIGFITAYMTSLAYRRCSQSRWSHSYPHGWRCSLLLPCISLIDCRGATPTGNGYSLFQVYGLSSIGCEVGC